MEYDLVFEGGGAKGMVFVGAMQEFEARGHTYKRLLGTSAGAITAALLAAGYTSQEMLEALGEKENGRSVFTSFLAPPGPFEKTQLTQSATLAFLRSVDLPLLPEPIERKFEDILVGWLATDARLACPYSFLEFGGWYSADHFVSWMKRRLDSGMHRGKPRQYSGMTLAQFYEATGVDLSVVASDTTAGAMLVLNHRTAPDVPLVWAVRMSMSIPLLWQEVIWQPDWGLYRGREMAGHAIVDGGMLSNFPIELFVSQETFVKQLMGPNPGQRVLGMLIDESQAVDETQAGEEMAAQAGLGQAPVLRRLLNLVNTALSARDKMVSESLEDLVVRLPAGGYGTTEFDMSDEKRNRLVEAGCATMRAYFDRPAGEISFDLDDEVASAENQRVLREADKVAIKILSR